MNPWEVRALDVSTSSSLACRSSAALTPDVVRVPQPPKETNRWHHCHQHRLATDPRPRHLPRSLLRHWFRHDVDPCTSITTNIADQQPANFLSPAPSHVPPSPCHRARPRRLLRRPHHVRSPAARLSHRLRLRLVLRHDRLRHERSHRP